MTPWSLKKEIVISFLLCARYMEPILGDSILSYWFRSNGEGTRLIRIPLALFF